MSANIHWKPVTPKTSRTLEHAFAPSSFINIMTRAFGSFPLAVGQRDIEKLRGMAATYTNEDNPFQEVVDLLEHHEAVELWAEY